VGTLAAELAAHARIPDAPRIYADANVPAGVVSFMRHELGWDVLHVIEHDDLRRATDARHYELARQLQRTLVTIDRDYLDDRRFPPRLSSGLIVIWAPNEALLARTLAEVDRRVFRTHEDVPHERLPLEGRKLVADPTWMNA
jgi:predicted nuclease of predicted toxin-antitoxin system